MFRLVIGVLVIGCAVGPVSAQRGGLTSPAPRSERAERSEGTGLALSRRFAVREDESGWWLIAPDGHRFFSLGICAAQPGVGRGEFDPENPAYAWWRQHPDPVAWAGRTADRLRSWGFTTLGGWTDSTTLGPIAAPDLWLTPVLHLGANAGAPWWDLWDPRNLRRMEDTAAATIGPLASDPRVLGYYSDNELGWWNASLWKATLEQPESSGQRRQLVSLLRTEYGSDWDRLRKDFDAEGATGWRELDRGGMVFLRPGGDGIRVQRRFLGVLAARYYSMMAGIIHRMDPRALYLGDRYQSFYYPEVAVAAAPYVDVVSCNLNAPWSDGTFPRFLLDTLHALTHRPVLVSEFYLAAQANRSGNRNTEGLYPVVADQRSRAEAAGTTLRRLAGLHQVVGADWFQFADEPRHGRADGENFNFGLVDLEDRPYAELISQFTDFDAERVRRQVGKVRPDATGGVPRAPTDPFARFERTHALEGWDRERGFVPASSPAPMADLYVAWSPDALYLGLFGLDIVESAYYRSTSMPKVDRALWTASVDGRPVVRARIGAGREALRADERVRIECLSGMDLDVRNVAAMGIPAGLVGRERFHHGDEVELHVEWVTHARANRMEWRGRFRLE